MQQLGLRNVKGDNLLQIVAYIYLAEILHKSKDPEHIAAHLFLILDWNMISWADCIITSNIELVGVMNAVLGSRMQKSC